MVNEDPTRDSFLDVVRPGTPGQRVIIEAGKTFSCRLKPGPADISIGDRTQYSFDVEGGNG